MNLNNKTLIITGVSSGIGAELARVARFQGARVIGIDLHEQGSLRLQIARSCDRVAAETWI
ncbi:hypothetical protein AL060_17485 [Pseudomonas syringae pv. rhaphiolepidis]|nr:hypothetical protein AL060_17485 [Pseudomonas syringae pv. rhaphiolepidis]